MRIDKSKIHVKYEINQRSGLLSVNAYYADKEIGGLYVRQDFDEETALNFIGEDDEEAPEPEPFVWLNLLEVNPNYRQNGIGTLLMNYFFDNRLYDLFSEQNTYMLLDVHPQGLGITKQILKAFYAQYGFEPSNNNYMIREI